MKNTRTQFATLLLSMACLLSGAFGQLTPSSDAYTNTASPTGNFGAKTLLDVESASQTTYIQFDLTAIPSGYTGSNITKATLKLYVNAVSKAGSFNVDFVNGTWSEATITANLSPALGTTIAASVPLSSSSVKDYINIDVTAALQAWLNGTQANDGIALVGNSPLNANFDSKENTASGHSPELDIVFAGGGGNGITGVLTASGSGLIGGGTSGTLNLSLTNICSANQVLQWSGTAWACANMSGGGTITGVIAGTDLTGGGNSGKVTLNLDTTKVPQLATANTFAGNQTVSGNLTATGTVTASGLSATNSAVSNVLSINSAASNPLYVATGSATGTTAIYGVALSTTGVAFGVEGVTVSNGTAYGVVGDAVATSGSPFGVYGLAGNSNTGVGVFGQTGTESNTAMSFMGRFGVGVWGEGGTFDENTGVLGTADDGFGGRFHNNSPSGFYTLYAQANNSASYPFAVFNAANGTYCNIDAGGNLNCSGAKHAVVPIDGGARKVALSAIESPKNWFEDAGSSHLVNGSTVVMLDPDFLQTVNTNLEYHVFLTPNGDSHGLYIANKTATSFEVREQGGGTSSIAFDYRLMALRKNYESIRFEDHSNDPDPRKMLTEHGRDGSQQKPPLARQKFKPPAGPVPIASNK